MPPTTPSRPVAIDAESVKLVMDPYLQMLLAYLSEFKMEMKTEIDEVKNIGRANSVKLDKLMALMPAAVSPEHRQAFADVLSGRDFTYSSQEGSSRESSPEVEGALSSRSRSSSSSSSSSPESTSAERSPEPPDLPLAQRLALPPAELDIRSDDEHETVWNLCVAYSNDVRY
jgi:hypothetical protein